MKTKSLKRLRLKKDKNNFKLLTSSRTMAARSAALAKNQKIIYGLTHLLADTYVLYVKTQNFHWNVRSAHFFSYHQAFDDQYHELAEAIDKVAERIRALRAPTPASLASFLKITSLKEASSNLEAEEMLQALMVDHELIGQRIESLFVAAEECSDQVTLDLLIERKTAHDKTAWMLRSALGLA